jgi:hypothetical protein
VVVMSMEVRVRGGRGGLGSALNTRPPTTVLPQSWPPQDFAVAGAAAFAGGVTGTISPAVSGTFRRCY